LLESQGISDYVGRDHAQRWDRNDDHLTGCQKIMKCRLVFWVIFATVTAGWAAPAQAIDDSSRAAARALVKEGAALYKAGRYEEARLKFMDAYEVAKVPTVAVWAAQANEQLGKLVAASELYESAILMQPNDLWVGDAQSKAQQQARDALKVLKPRIPTLKLVLSGASPSDVEVTVDNVNVPSSLLAVERSVDPGHHTISAMRDGKTVTETVTVGESEKRVVTLLLPDSSMPPPAAIVPLPAGTPPIAPAPPGNAPVAPQPGSQPPPPVAVPTAPPPGSQPVGVQPTVAGTSGPPRPPEPPMPPAQRNAIAAPTSQPTGMAPGSQDASHDATVDGASQPAPGTTQRTWGWVGVGLGAAGLAVGTIGGFVLGSKHSSLLNDGCSSTTCVGSNYNDRVDSYNSWRTISTAGFVVGGLGTAVGITLLLTSPKRNSAPSVGLMMERRTVGLKGAF
jgi:hypothetical protein